MSREIKFRAWISATKEMVKVEKTILDIPAIIYTNSKGEKCLDSLKDNAFGIEIMQYTGLHDKNGKEIYEGDVVHYVYKPGEGFWNQDCIGIIKWNTTGFKMEPLPGKGGLCTWLISIPGAMEPSCRELFEITGNIYENSELASK
jgi:uncharacterized phage protein (TIGR01671 family)